MVSWLLVTGCWLLVAGCWLLDAGYWFQINKKVFGKQLLSI
jgi:hypothetical protein